jgi:hypothetical protein
MSLRERLGMTLLLQQERPSPIEEELLRGDVRGIRAAAASTKHEGSSNVNKVALATGQVCFHKPAAGVNEPQARWYGHEPFGVLINESAAWMVAKALGAPFTEWVPVTVIRSIWPRDPDLVGGYGSLSIGIDGDTDVDEPFNDPSYCDPAAFWDCVIGQQDRHFGNFRFDRAASHPPLGLIDSGYAFAAPTAWNTYGPHASEFVKKRRLEGRVRLTSEETGWLGVLITDLELQEALEAILAPDQFQAFVSRIRRMFNPPNEILSVLEF